MGHAPPGCIPCWQLVYHPSYHGICRCPSCCHNLLTLVCSACLPGVCAAHATASFCFLMMVTMLSRVIRGSSLSRHHGQQCSRGMSFANMSTDPWQLAWADLVSCNTIAGVFQGGGKPGGPSQHQSGPLLATWSRLLLRPIPLTQSSSTQTISPPQLSHNGLLTRTAQASTTSRDLSLTMRWELHCITGLL